MIEVRTGDLLASAADVLVNSVNCEGRVESRLARRFNHDFPENTDFYLKACAANKLKLGSIWVTEYTTPAEPWRVMNVTTRARAADPVTMESLQIGIEMMTFQLSLLNTYFGIRSAAIPAFGCGRGGLTWRDLHPVLVRSLARLEEKIDFFLYTPLGVAS